MTRTQLKTQALAWAVGIIDEALRTPREDGDFTPREQNSIQYELGELRHDLAERAKKLEETENARAQKKALKLAA